MLLMKYPLLILTLTCLFSFSSCQNSYRQYPVSNSSSAGISGVSEDAYQVTVDEYGDYFESRYGLLYQKFNDKPFTGRILTIDKGESGEYVSSDESWTEGKKDGVSARWFSNGKMYERNYKEGRWHGTVTRWANVKNVCSHTQMGHDTVRKQLGDLTVPQSNFLRNHLLVQLKKRA